MSAAILAALAFKLADELNRIRLVSGSVAVAVWFETDAERVEAIRALGVAAEATPPAASAAASPGDLLGADGVAGEREQQRKQGEHNA